MLRKQSSVISVIIFILLLYEVYAVGDLKIDKLKNNAIVTYDDLNISIDKFEAFNNDVITLGVNTGKSRKTDVCFIFDKGVNLSMINISTLTKVNKLWLDDKYSNTKYYLFNSICYNDVDFDKSDNTLIFSMYYANKGRIKYDITLLDKSYNKNHTKARIDSKSYDLDPFLNNDLDSLSGTSLVANFNNSVDMYSDSSTIITVSNATERSSSVQSTWVVGYNQTVGGYFDSFSYDQKTTCSYDYAEFYETYYYADGTIVDNSVNSFQDPCDSYTTKTSYNTYPAKNVSYVAVRYRAQSGNPPSTAYVNNLLITYNRIYGSPDTNVRQNGMVYDSSRAGLIYLFNVNNLYTDYSGNGRTGVGFNITMNSSGANFNGNNSIINTSYNLNITDNYNFTISAFIIPKSFSGTGNIINKMSNTLSSIYMMDYWSSSNTIGCRIYTTGGLQSVTYTPEMNVLQMVTCVKKSNNISMYLNSQYKGSILYTGAIYDNGLTNFTLGATTINTNFFNGSISKLYIYNYAMNDSEILFLNRSYLGDTNKLNYSNNSAVINGNKLYYQLEYSTLPTGAAARSYCYWAKYNKIDGERWVISNGAVSSGQGIFMGGDYGYYSVGDFSSNVNSSYIIPANEWHHYCMTYNGSIMKLYVDAVPRVNATKTLNTVNGYALLGLNGNGIGYFNGSIDDLRIYGRVLSDSEISYFYNSQNNNSISKTICLIDERSNDYFDLDYITGASLYHDDNSSSINLKNLNTPCAFFYSDNTSKIRLELSYDYGTVITRYVDVGLFNNTDTIRLCANVNGTTHYEQMAISSSQRPVYIKSVFADCYIAADMTRFTYQESYSLKAYTINSQYYLYVTDSNGNKVYLAGLDGSISSYYNLDSLEFNNRKYNLNLIGSAVSVDANSTGVIIYYNNQLRNSNNTQIKLTRQNTSTLIFSTTEYSSPNNFTVFFDYSLYNISDIELFKVEAISNQNDGSSTTSLTFFNVQGNTGWLDSKLVFVISIFLTIFGLTFVSLRFALSWFGVIIQMAAIIILTLGVSTWYIVLLQAIDFIVLIYFVFMGLSIYSSSVIQ